MECFIQGRKCQVNTTEDRRSEVFPRSEKSGWIFMRTVGDLWFYEMNRWHKDYLQPLLLGLSVGLADLVTGNTPRPWGFLPSKATEMFWPKFGIFPVFSLWFCPQKRAFHLPWVMCDSTVSKGKLGPVKGSVLKSWSWRTSLIYNYKYTQICTITHPSWLWGQVLKVGLFFLKALAIYLWENFILYPWENIRVLLLPSEMFLGPAHTRNGHRALHQQAKEQALKYQGRKGRNGFSLTDSCIK